MQGYFVAFCVKKQVHPQSDGWGLGQDKREQVEGHILLQGTAESRGDLPQSNGDEEVDEAVRYEDEDAWDVEQQSFGISSDWMNCK